MTIVNRKRIIVFPKLAEGQISISDEDFIISTWKKQGLSISTFSNENVGFFGVRAESVTILSSSNENVSVLELKLEKVT